MNAKDKAMLEGLRAMRRRRPLTANELRRYSQLVAQQQMEARRAQAVRR